MDTYYVTILDTSKGLDYQPAKRELSFAAEDFGHAEELAKPYVEDDEEIITIIKDFS